jgi:endogenous inhibitor of DNA gyrase (YacG/DUF329 family)
MLPRTVPCEDCGETAFVRAYGRVEYDWGQEGPEAGQIATKPHITMVRLTIDCPNCGVKTQDFRPGCKVEGRGLPFDSPRLAHDRP